MTEPIDYSRTERIVLVIDLHPIIVLQKPNGYLTAVVASIKRLLKFPPLCNSLFTYRLFFSSLSPLRSDYVVHRLLPHSTGTSLSFDDHSQTLTSLLKILDFLSIAPFVAELADGRPLASHTAGSLLQLVHDYSWDADLGTLKGKGSNQFPLRSNLVVLFSTICSSICSLSDYLEVDAKSGLSSDSDELLKKFCSVFGALNHAFVRKDIQFSWVNVNYDLEGSESNIETELGLFVKGIRNLGCGFCSTDSIVLGSALIPFRLIYPKIGFPFEFLNLNGSNRRSDVQLSLEILDVNGKPLECSFCDLELLNLKAFPHHKSDEPWSSLEFRDSQNVGFDKSEEAFWGRFCDGSIMLCIKAVQRCNEGEKIQGSSSAIFLVKELPGDPKKQRKGSSEEHFADRVLGILSRETNGTSNCNPMPIWQIILSFLCGEGYWALVSLSNGYGDAVLGILKPFSAYSALLSVFSNDCHILHDCGASDPSKIEDSCAEMSNSNGFVGSQTETSTSGNCEPIRAEKKKMRKKHMYQGLTWASFCKAAFECSDFDLSAIYFARKFDKNKKLKFFICWMKQIVKLSHQNLQMLHMLKSTQTESPRSPNCSSEQPEKQEEARTASCSETTETFFNNISERIQIGLESGVHVQTLAEQLVKSSIHRLLQGYDSCEQDENAQAQNPAPVDDSCKSLGAKLTKLLLTDPKEMNCTDECNNPSSKPHNPNTSEFTVRRYELQVFLRMEIFRSNIAATMEETLKKKLVKQICSFLDIIQYLIDGGIHGNVSLYNYVEKTIKMRYSDVLEDIVKDIYSKMDLLPFGDEDETRAFLFNSEDSSQSWRDKEMCDQSESQDINQSVSLEDETYEQQHRENVDESSEGITKEEEPSRQLSEARARRERARRFMSFTSWIPDLQRVWAPKPLLKGVKGRSDSFHKDSKRKERQMASCSVVCETPLSSRKRQWSQENGERDEEYKDPGNYSYSVSKALFQDD